MAASTWSRKDEAASGSEVARLVVDEAQLPALVIDPRTRRILAANAEFLDVFEWDSEDLEGTPLAAIVQEEDAWEVRNMVSIIAYGGSCDPVSAEVSTPGDRAVPATWVGIPNILEDPTKAVTVVCRPTGLPIGKPLGPPAFLRERERPDSNPSPQQARDDKRMSRTSQYLWEREDP